METSAFLMLWKQSRHPKGCLLLKIKSLPQGFLRLKKGGRDLKKSGATGAWALSKARFDTDEMPIQTLDREEVPYYGNHYIIYISYVIHVSIPFPYNTERVGVMLR